MKTSAQQRRRLKQLHWDKIRAPQQGTVWARDNQPRVNLNFDELENLFQVRACSSPHILLGHFLHPCSYITQEPPARAALKEAPEMVFQDHHTVSSTVSPGRVVRSPCISASMGCSVYNIK